MGHLRECPGCSSITQLLILTNGRTSVVFEPGNPPATTAPVRVRRGPVDVAVPEVLRRNAKPPIPTWLTAIATSTISSACDCLSIPTPTSTIASVSTSTVTVVTTTTVTVRILFLCMLSRKCFAKIGRLRLTYLREPLQWSPRLTIVSQHCPQSHINY